MDKNKFPVQLSLRIDWAELDLFGHVNNVMFIKYIQAARVNYWEKIGLYQQFLETKCGPMLASVTCNFLKPLHYPGDIIIQTRMNYIKNTSFSLQHIILNDQNETVARSEDVMVMFDFNTNEKINFPDDLRKAVILLEGKEFSIS